MNEPYTEENKQDFEPQQNREVTYELLKTDKLGNKKIQSTNKLDINNIKGKKKPNMQFQVSAKDLLRVMDKSGKKLTQTSILQEIQQLSQQSHQSREETLSNGKKSTDVTKAIKIRHKNLRQASTGELFLENKKNKRLVPGSSNLLQHSSNKALDQVMDSDNLSKQIKDANQQQPIELINDMEGLINDKQGDSVSSDSISSDSLSDSKGNKKNSGPDIILEQADQSDMLSQSVASESFCSESQCSALSSSSYISKQNQSQIANNQPKQQSRRPIADFQRVLEHNEESKINDYTREPQHQLNRNRNVSFGMHYVIINDLDSAQDQDRLMQGIQILSQKDTSYTIQDNSNSAQSGSVAELSEHSPSFSNQKLTTDAVQAQNHSPKDQQSQSHDITQDQKKIKTLSRINLNLKVSTNTNLTEKNELEIMTPIEEEKIQSGDVKQKVLQSQKIDQLYERSNKAINHEDTPVLWKRARSKSGERGQQFELAQFEEDSASKSPYPKEKSNSPEFNVDEDQIKPKRMHDVSEESKSPEEAKK